jgi:hypothetical protein
MHVRAHQLCIFCAIAAVIAVKHFGMPFSCSKMEEEDEEEEEEVEELAEQVDEA